MKEVNKAAYTCEHSAHQVSEELCELDVDTEYICYKFYFCLHSCLLHLF